jgi:L-iditol 2-dehydrogenase/galactitol-1-phosphate 5-dehydrogenase
MVLASLGRTVDVLDLVSHVEPFEDAQQVLEGLADRRVWANKTVFAVSPEARAEAAGVLGASLSRKEATS